ncbi:hypothetical protein PABG_11081 [Paracoccidioides brasiliensis Pb03]|nr:hypothetical protein PABG_11081 [Paracoccidioides brasiliensis Pb03]
MPQPPYFLLQEQYGCSTIYHAIEEEVFLNYLESTLCVYFKRFPTLGWPAAVVSGPRLCTGTNEDPGVEWRVFRHRNIAATSLVRTPSERAECSGIWIRDGFNHELFLSNTLLPLHNLHDCKGLPSMHIQVTLFSDGGYDINVKIARSLADAQAMKEFVHKPIFEPARLDACAAGGIDGTAPDAVLAS